MKRGLGLMTLGMGMCIGGIATAAPPATPETYTINLSPPAKVGDLYHVVSKATEKSDTITLRAHGARQEEKVDMAVDLDANVKVLKVDSRGSETYLICTVNRMQLTEAGGTPREVLPPGSVLTTQVAPIPGALRFQRFTALRSGNLTPAQAALIAKVITAHPPDAPTDQDIFGTATPQPIGAGWALNRERGCKYFEGLHIQIEPRDFTGKAQFVGIEKIGGRDCYHVDGGAKAAKFVSTFTSNVQTEKASLSFKFSEWIPRDGSRFGKMTSETHVEMQAKGVDDNVQGFRRQAVSDSSQESTIEPMK